MTAPSSSSAAAGFMRIRVTNGDVDGDGGEKGIVGAIVKASVVEEKEEEGEG